MSDDGMARAAGWLTAWDAQGFHRTATAGDAAGADWLIGEAVGLGAAPAVEDFALDRLDPVDAYLECSGWQIPASRPGDRLHPRAARPRAVECRAVPPSLRRTGNPALERG